MHVQLINHRRENINSFTHEHMGTQIHFDTFAMIQCTEVQIFYITFSVNALFTIHTKYSEGKWLKTKRKNDERFAGTLNTFTPLLMVIQNMVPVMESRFAIQTQLNFYHVLSVVLNMNTSVATNFPVYFENNLKYFCSQKFWFKMHIIF